MTSYTSVLHNSNVCTGPSHNHSIGPPYRDLLNYDMVITTNRNLGDEIVFTVEKNRYNGMIGNMSLKEAIEICSEMLINLKFQGSNKLFQENLRLRLLETMNDVLLGNDYIPKNIT